MSTRSIPASAFSDDDGRADAGLAAALERFSSDPARHPDVLAALHRARILAPVVAQLDVSETTATGLSVEKTSGVAVPLLEGTDGRRALPVFSALVTLARWDPSARPVPVAGPQAAEVAVAMDAQVLVLDPAGPVSCVLQAPELRALVAGRGRRPAYDDEGLAADIAAVVRTEPTVRAAWLLPEVGVDARLGLLLGGESTSEGDESSGTVGGSAATLRRLAQRVAALAGWEDHAVRGLDVAVLSPADAPDRPPVFRRFLD